MGWWGWSAVNRDKEFWSLIVIGLFVVCGILFPLAKFSRSDLRREDRPTDELRESVEYREYEGDRSSAWQRVRDAFVKRNPVCEACGTREDLNVHHVLPFHTNPSLELDEGNLITLCRRHHFEVGHDPDGLHGPLKPNWSSANPKVREESAVLRGRR